jgi:hypothetical protein
MTTAHAQPGKEVSKRDLSLWPMPADMPEGNYRVTTKDGKKVATKLIATVEKPAPPPEEEEVLQADTSKADMALWVAAVALLLSGIVFGSWLRDVLRSYTAK